MATQVERLKAELRIAELEEDLAKDKETPGRDPELRNELRAWRAAYRPLREWEKAIVDAIESDDENAEAEARYELAKAEEALRERVG